MDRHGEGERRSLAQEFVPPKPLILTIDDEEQLNRSLSLHLGREYTVHSATSGAEGVEKARGLRPNCVLLDLKMPDMDGMDVLKAFKQLDLSMPVIVMSAYGDIQSAVQAIKLGAVDFVPKPFDVDRLGVTIRDILHHKGSLAEGGKSVSSKDKISRGALGAWRVVGNSPQIRKVWETVEKFAPTDIPILLEGEPGTGKELFGRAIHELSRRSNGPFIAADCAAIPESLWESEFFGYEKGAFTGADQSKPGLFALAHGGTLFLDEVCNLPLNQQAKFLRVLQEGEIRPLGAKKSMRTDVRTIAVANINLTQAVSLRAFREDLYHRLSAVKIFLPPLRDREGDIPLLVRYFLDMYGAQYGKESRIADQTMEILKRYHWPGNCRELSNVIQSSFLMAKDCILPEHLPSYLVAPSQASQAKQGEDIGKDHVEAQVAIRVNIQEGIDLKRVGSEAAQRAQGEIIKRVQERLSLSQAKMAAFFKIDPKTLRALLKTGRGKNER